VAGSARGGDDVRAVLFGRTAAFTGGAISRTEGASVIIAVGWISLGRVPLFCSDGVIALFDDAGFRDAEFSFGTDSIAIAVLPHDGTVAVLSAGLWFGLSEWFETLSGVPTRLRSPVESLLDGDRLSLDRRSLVCVCAAAEMETARKTAITSRSESLFILTLNSVVWARFIGQGTAIESLENLPARIAGSSELVNNERDRVSGKCWNL